MIRTTWKLELNISWLLIIMIAWALNTISIKSGIVDLTVAVLFILFAWEIEKTEKVVKDE